MKLTTRQLAEKKFLKSLIKPTSTIIVQQTKVARSGMSRRLELYVMAKNELIRITYSVAQLMGSSINSNGILVTGCGMDMHFATVSNLSYYLFGGKKLKNFKGNGGSCLAWKSI